MTYHTIHQTEAKGHKLLWTLQSKYYFSF